MMKDAHFCYKISHMLFLLKRFNKSHILRDLFFYFNDFTCRIGTQTQTLNLKKFVFHFNENRVSSKTLLLPFLVYVIVETK